MCNLSYKKMYIICSRHDITWILQNLTLNTNQSTNQLSVDICILSYIDWLVYSANFSSISAISYKYHLVVIATTNKMSSLFTIAESIYIYIPNITKWVEFHLLEIVWKLLTIRTCNSIYIQMKPTLYYVINKVRNYAPWNHEQIPRRFVLNTSLQKYIVSKFHTRFSCEIPSRLHVERKDIRMIIVFKLKRFVWENASIIESAKHTCKYWYNFSHTHILLWN